MDTPAISLVDKTRPTESVDELSHSKSHSKRFSKRWARDELIKRKYAKWQPQNLNVPEESSASRRSSRRSSVGRCQDGRRSGISTGRNSLQEVDTVDFATSDQENGNGASIANVDTDNNNGDGSDQDENKPTRELDILYENQRGWFIFGIPLYSHGSLLNFDPSAWVTQELKDSPVNITNAQLPDPSWEWVWHTWYVDMSGDIDEQGWQYSWSFSSTAWHGTHPWFHSFVRRRRWVRMRAKKASERSKRGRSGFEKAHMLNEDYFTIHSSREREATAASSIAPTQLSSNYLSRASTKVAEDVAAFEEIPNIPTLMYAIRVAIVDREKIEALKKFIDNGGEELYYLNERIPEIMHTFVFQTSRWQFLSYLTSVVDELSRQAPEGEEADDIQRKHDNLARAAETTRHHLRGPDICGDGNQTAVTELLDLTPISKQDGLLSKHIWQFVDELDRESRIKRIKGIPKAAEIGREGHIY